MKLESKQLRTSIQRRCRAASNNELREGGREGGMVVTKLRKGGFSKLRGSITLQYALPRERENVRKITEHSRNLFLK